MYKEKDIGISRYIFFLILKYEIRFIPHTVTLDIQEIYKALKIRLNRFRDTSTTALSTKFQGRWFIENLSELKIFFISAYPLVIKMTL